MEEINLIDSGVSEARVVVTINYHSGFSTDGACIYDMVQRVIDISPSKLLYVDTDNDGMNDSWEIEHFGDLDIVTADPQSDYDADGYSDKQEYLNFIAGIFDPEYSAFDPKIQNAPNGEGYNVITDQRKIRSIIPVLNLLLHDETTQTEDAAPTDVATVTSSTGQVWMDRNLGASRVAQSYDDEAAYGDLYQWGRGTDGHEKRDSETTSTLISSDTPGHGKFITTSSAPYDWRSPQNDNLWQGGGGVNNPCPSGFRLPTFTELEQERALWWPYNDAASAFASPMRFVLSGSRRAIDGTIWNEGEMGSYWSSTVDDGNSFKFTLYIHNNSYFSSCRAEGLSVRCLKD